MKEKKNIDSSIRRKLEDYQVTPPQHVWNNVQGQLLDMQKRKRLVFWRWISVAAVVAIALMAGWYFNGNLSEEKNISATNEVVHTEKESNEILVQKSDDISRNGQTEKLEDDNITLAASEQMNNRFDAKNKSADEINGATEILNSREQFAFARLERADGRLAEKNRPEAQLAHSLKSGSEAELSNEEQILIAENIKNLKDAEKDGNNWKMGMYVAPGYSSYTANHSESYLQNMTYSGKAGNTNVSTGFSVQYKTGRRWIVESGLYYAQSGQESGNPVNLFALKQEGDNMLAPSDKGMYFNNNVRVENNNLQMNSTAGIIEFSSTPKGAEFSSDFDASKTAESSIMVPDGQFSQVFEFMEVPVFVRYRVVDSKFGIELITGLNAGIVIGNNAYIENQYGLQNIGETKDISTVNLSGTLGVGLNYALSRHLAVALEPRFNYYLNSINTNSSVDFRPYRIGFYTGISYSF